MSTECLDISTLNNPCLTFNYHMYGATIGTLDVLVNGDTIWTLSANQGNQWNDAQVSLTSYIGVDVTVEFVASYGGGWEGDIAIDNIVVDECLVIPGCTDPIACNYDANATMDDGSCTYQDASLIDLTSGSWTYVNDGDCNNIHTGQQQYIISFNSDGTGLLNNSYPLLWSLCNDNFTMLYGGSLGLSAASLYTGTVDVNGNISAGTSTGGRSNKKWGRLGDVPIIGAGTYANNECCGISATGWGEFFIRNVVAYDIAALVNYKKLNIKEASKLALEKVKDLGGDGGVIVLDKNGDVSMDFNTAGMYRAYINNEGELTVKIYND
jgi:hypothetical protein